MCSRPTKRATVVLSPVRLVLLCARVFNLLIKALIVQLFVFSLLNCLLDRFQCRLCTNTPVSSNSRPRVTLTTYLGLSQSLNKQPIHLLNLVQHVRLEIILCGMQRRNTSQRVFWRFKDLDLRVPGHGDRLVDIVEGVCEVNLVNED